MILDSLNLENLGFQLMMVENWKYLLPSLFLRVFFNVNIIYMNINIRN